ncbi:hypothetical protein ACWELB_20785 [Streptomyces asiaticus]
MHCPELDCSWSVHGIPDKYTQSRARHLAEHQAKEHGAASAVEKQLAAFGARVATFECGAERAMYRLACELRDELNRVRAELAARQEDIAFMDRCTLPDLHRKAQAHEDGKKRWRDRAEKAEARVAALESERQETNAALAERDVALKAAEKRIAELESDDIATQYGIRTPDGDVLNSTEDYKESVARLGRYQDTWPDAVLVERTVRHGEWTEAE